MRLLATGSQILASRLGQVAVNAAIGMLLARALAPVGLGHYSLTIALIMLLAAIFNGGMGLAAVPPLRHREVSLSRMLQAQRTWIALVALLLLLLGVLASRTPLAGVAMSRLGWTVTAATGTLMAVLALLAFDIFFYDLLAQGRLVVGPLVNLGRAVLHAALLAGLLLVNRLGLGGAVVSFAVAQLAAAMLVARVLLRQGQQDQPPTSAELTSDALQTEPGHAAASLAGLSVGRLVRRTLRAGWIGQVSAVASLLHLRLDLALVSAFWGAATVGIYAAAVMVGELLWHLPGALSPILIYSSADPGHSAERDLAAARAVRLGLAVTAAAAIPLALLSGPLLRLVFGEAYAASAAPLQALLPGIVAFAPGAVLAGDFIGRGHPAWNAQASTLTVLVNIICGLLLIPHWGALGASWASTIAYSVGAAAMIARFQRTTGLPLRQILLVSARDLR